MLQVDQRGYLARSLLASLGRTSSDMTSQVDLEFQPGAYYGSCGPTPSRREQQAQMLKILRSRGSIVEFSAHLPIASWAQQGFLETLEFAAGHFDPSIILLFVVANHQHDDDEPRCWGCVAMTHLLQLGAKATAPGFAVGVLQIAAAGRDFTAVSLLLEG
ncbi:hypothetical protein VTI28DRAFT_2531 [Corynascus sepedonium]